MLALAVMAALIVTALASAPAAAAPVTGEELSIGVSPVLSAYDLHSGDSVTFEAVFSSGGTQAFHATVSASDALLRESGFEYETPGQEYWAAGSWLKVEPTEFDMGPDERRVLTVTVAVPDGIPDGEYYAAFNVLVTPSTAAASPNGSAVQFAGSVASVVCVAVGEGEGRLARLIPYGGVPRPSSPGRSFLTRLGGGLKHWWLGLVLNDWSVAPLAEGQLLRVFAPLENLCGVHIQPRVKVTFRRGENVLRQVTVTGEIILPESKKIIEVPWPDAPLYGFFTLDLEVEYGGPETLRASRTFLILPVKGILGLAAFAFGLGYLVAGRKRKSAAPKPPAAGLPG